MREGLEKLGWIEGHNLRLETRYANGSADRLGEEAAELVQLRPDVLIASATSALATSKKATSTIPIVFAQVTDPVGAGFVRSWRGRAAISPDLRNTSFRSASNGWSC